MPSKIARLLCCVSTQLLQIVLHFSTTVATTMDFDLTSFDVVGEADELHQPLPVRSLAAHLIDVPPVEIDDFDRGIVIGNVDRAKKQNPTMDYVPVSNIDTCVCFFCYCRCLCSPFYFLLAQAHCRHARSSSVWTYQSHRLDCFF